MTALAIAVAIAMPLGLAQAVPPAATSAPQSTPPPTTSTPIATDPAAPPPPAPAPSADRPPLPVANAPSPQEPDEPAERPEVPERAATGIGYAAILGLGLANLAVDLPSRQTSTSGGAFFHFGASGFWRVLSLRLRLTGFIGGGGAGFEGAYSGEAWIGAGARVSNNDQIFFRVGVDGYAFKNDELEASTGSVPGFAIGYQLWADGLGFEIAPRVALTPRSEYEPGDEAQGRRSWRRLNARLGFGGAATITTRHFFLDGSLLRVADSDPLTVVDGRLCLLPFHIALCGFSQYWRSAAIPTAPAAGPPVDVGSLFIGGSIGIGAAGSNVDRLRWY